MDEKFKQFYTVSKQNCTCVGSVPFSKNDCVNSQSLENGILPTYTCTERRVCVCVCRNLSYTEGVPINLNTNKDIAPHYTQVGTTQKLTCCLEVMYPPHVESMFHTPPLYVCRNIHCTFEGWHGQ